MLKWVRLLMNSEPDATGGDVTGYDGATETAAPTETDKPAEETAKPAEDATGYGGDKPAEETEKPAEETAKPAETQPEYELNLEGIPEELATDAKSFIDGKGFTEEQSEAIISKYKELQANSEKQTAEYEAEVKRTYAKWEQELRADTEFGGENFAHNVHQVNKLLNEDMTGLKNLLTTGGKRLPPIVMKDLSKIAGKLYGETEMVQGDSTSKEKEWNPLDFYSKTK